MRGCLVGWFWLRYLMRLQLYFSWGYNQMKICLGWMAYCQGARSHSWHWCQLSVSRLFLWASPSVQFSCSVVSDSLRPHELQHTRPPCPSPTPRVHQNLCPLSWRCCSTISSSVLPFSSCPQSFPASGSFQMSQLFTSGGQSIWVSALTSVLPINRQDWYTG